jgi:hypothetical protein
LSAEEAVFVPGSRGTHEDGVFCNQGPDAETLGRKGCPIKVGGFAPSGAFLTGLAAGMGPAALAHDGLVAGVRPLEWRLVQAQLGEGIVFALERELSWVAQAGGRSWARNFNARNGCWLHGAGRASYL